MDPPSRGTDPTSAVTQPPPSDEGTNPFPPPAGVDVPGYDILSELGRGGMGVVFKATQRDLNRPVALKMILPGTLASADDVRRFRSEAEAMGVLQHPHIVRVHEVGEHAGRPFFSMDFLAGPTLARRLADGPLPGKIAARYLIAVAGAIHYAHEKSILHRDLKPSNILLDEQDQPHVTDFGLAKRLGTEAGQTRTGAVLGTPSYMAPEQATGTKDLTRAVDVYGLGAVLYECLTGRPPFRAETPLDTVLQVLERQPAPPRLLNANVERDLETICLKCLEKDPRRRYPTAAALAEDLDRYVQGEPIAARSLNLVDRLASALSHSQYDVQFGGYAAMLFGFAGIVFVTELVLTFLIHTRQPVWSLPLTHVTRILLMVGLLWRCRGSRLLPASAAERLMWSVWLGYILTSFLIGATSRLMFGLTVGWEVHLYPYLAAVTGLAFFALGSSYWGWCYAFGLAFYALAGLMTLDLRWAPVEFGALWAAVLVAIGMRLRRLAEEGKGRDNSNPSSAGS